ncbi:hypothetical protein DF133_13135 [Burkholderia cenocepacia]|nr:hypothetical protein DF133_13135 [Burkholderia cenocepacia]
MRQLPLNPKQNIPAQLLDPITIQGRQIQNNNMEIENVLIEQVMPINTCDMIVSTSPHQERLLIIHRLPLSDI